MKLIYLVIDGAPDRPSEGATALDLARKPSLDGIARKGVCGLVYPVSKGHAPESDVAVMSILGYNPFIYYAGRGSLEAYGIGVTLVEGKEVAFRGNFATIDPKTLEVVDRRVGRSLTAEEARELAESLSGMELLDTGYARVYHTVGHRVVVVIGDRERELSPEVSNTDPAYERKGPFSVAVARPERKVVRCRPLAPHESAKRTSDLVNEFTEKAIRRLSEHPVNERRRSRGLLEANAVLLRDAGGALPRLPPMSRYGLRFAAIVEMPVERGIALAAGMELVEIPPDEGLDPAERYKLLAERTLYALSRYDAVYVHVKGPDEPGHDGNLEGKVKALELIDEHYVSEVAERCGNDCCWIVTSDHATPYTLRAHSDDPVPVAVAGPGVQPDGVARFAERECAKGGLGVIERGWTLLDRALAILRGEHPSPAGAARS